MKNERYNELCCVIEDTSFEISQKFATQITCKVGCHSCCIPNLSISKIEKEIIKDFVQQNLNIYNKLKSIERDNPHESTRCQMLDREGNCSIYEVRPIICRTHGYPILYSDKDQWFADVCSLNFTDYPLENLEENDFIIVDIINQHIAISNLEEGFDDSRYELSLNTIMD